MSERTVTTRDGFVTKFNAQSDAEAKAYKVGWADCLAEVREEDSFRSRPAGSSQGLKLTEDERETIENAWIIAPSDGPRDGVDDPMYLAVEHILTARSADMEARIRALAEECERLNVWMAHDVPDANFPGGWRGVNREAAPILRALLDAAPAGGAEDE